MEIKMNIIIFVIGLGILINGVWLSLLSNFNLGIVVTVLAGLFFTVWGAFYDKIMCATRKGVLLWLRRLVVLLICAETALIGFVFSYGQHDNADYSEDAVIVLGAGLRGDRITIPLKLRLDEAVKYHQQNPYAVIVVSGGQGFQETVSEASAMKKYLVENGVNADKILTEEMATSTSENMRFSKEILDETFGTSYKTVIITNNFHIYRSAALAKKEGLRNVRHIHAGLQTYNILPCGMRESLAVLKMWVFD